MTGIEPALNGFAIRPLTFRVTPIQLASRYGIEPQPRVLETLVLPLHQRETKKTLDFLGLGFCV